jgi:hypothetical protein
VPSSVVWPVRVSRQSRIGYEFLRCLNSVVGQATRDDVSFRACPIGDLSYRVSRVGGLVA